MTNDDATIVVECERSRTELNSYELASLADH
jgi:hypothetical protein